jgi:hypothetical protein
LMNSLTASCRPGSHRRRYILTSSASTWSAAGAYGRISCPWAGRSVVAFALPYHDQHLCCPSWHRLLAAAQLL